MATTLDMMGQDVLAVDKDGELVNRWSSQIPTVQADMTDVMALEQINASDFDTAVVAIGDSVEASVITAGNLLDAGISDILGQVRVEGTRPHFCNASAHATSSTRKRRRQTRRTSCVRQLS